MLQVQLESSLRLAIYVPLFDDLQDRQCMWFEIAPAERIWDIMAMSGYM